jgi:chromate transport protein ChrA
MAGFIVGSLILTWILCSALNGFVEYAAIRQWLNRGTAFVSMVVGVLLIAGGMVALAVWGFAESSLAKEAVNPHQVTNAVRTSCVLNVLFALGYCAFQLRRFWED